MHLHAAAARGDVEGIAYALMRGTPVDAPDRSGSTALSWAIHGARGAQGAAPQRNIAAFKMLLGAGADIRKLDHLGTPPLIQAAQVSDPVFFEELLARGADPGFVTESGYTALVHAAYQAAGPAKMAMIDRLFELRVDINRETKHGETPASVCYIFGDFVTLRHLLQLGADPAPLHWKKLHQAVAFGSLDDVRALAGGAADINAQDRRFQISPWLLALRVGDPAKIQSLAERGADLAQIGRLGHSALHLAAAAGATASVRWLLDYGADIHAVDNFGDTPLHEAVKSRRHHVVQMLLAAGADPGRENSVQEKPIHSALQSETMRLLVQQESADVNAIGGCGEWPLKLAAADNDAELVAWLLHQGAKVDLTHTGDTALHAAVGADARECVELLLAAGADANAQDVDGWTPLFSARSREMIDRLKAAGADPGICDQVGDGPEAYLQDPLLIERLAGPKPPRPAPSTPR